MASLKSRQKFIPGGFKFYQPETNWSAPRNASFQVIVNSLILHRKNHPFLAQQNSWAMDEEGVASEVDNFNATICLQMGWTDYVQQGVWEGPPPKFPAPPQSDPSKVNAVAGRVKKIWSGVRTLNDWLDSNDPAVPAEQSAARAAVCAACPKNGPGDFTAWFTQPASEAIRRQLARVGERKLATPSDAAISICEVCLCPLKLKVHTPLAYINTRLSPEVLADLEAVPGCWIIQERRA